jgi:glycogen debranching enzyme
MDAKEKGVRAFSPRGNRAIDIQALWIEALLSAIVLTFMSGEVAVGRREIDAHRLMAKSLADYFVDKSTGRLIDHLKPDGSPDLALRPNAFFALDTLEENRPRIHMDEVAVQKQKMIWASDLWKGLVYPWGVATLSQDDPDFHPYHEHWRYYHKDAAYHNGTVWPWLNGVAMTTLLRFGVQKEPWQLFENMNRQALREGAVGSLAECADALPVPSATWARRTGTFLQAWSNAEHLRVWHEEILGVRIQGGGTHVEIRPQLPKNVLNVAMSMPLNKGVLIGHWHRGNAYTWMFELQGTDADIAFRNNWPSPSQVSWALKAGQKIEIVKEGSRVKLTAFDRQGEVLGTKIDDGWDSPSSLSTLRDEVFANLGFCGPKLAPNLKSLSVYHDPPLTY